MLEEEAIKAALQGNWAKAIELNEEILTKKKNELEALNRLAFAYSKLGQSEKAVKTYRQLLKLDPYNPIARKNFAKFKNQKKPRTSNSSSLSRFGLSSSSPSLRVEDLTVEDLGVEDLEPRTSISPSLFLAEGEKIKSVNLVNVTEQKTLQTLTVGEEVKVNRRGFELQVKSKNGTYLGTFPDDAGRNLINLLKKKAKLKFFLQDIGENQLTVFVKWTL